MPLQESGSINLTNIATEFGGTAPHSLSEYYAGGANVPGGAEGTGGPIPASGAISFSQFYGAPVATVATEFQFLSEASDFSPDWIGVHTQSISTTWGTWLAPLPEILTGQLTTVSFEPESISSPILMPDGFTYGSGTIQTVFTSFSFSLTRVISGSIVIPANDLWVPFNNVIINGPGHVNTTLAFGDFAAPATPGFGEFFLNPTGATSISPLVVGGTYTITFD